MGSSRHADDLMDLARTLLLFQGALLIATTIEALLWAAVFPGANGAAPLLTAAATCAILAGRLRLRADRKWSRRLVYIVEGFILVPQAINVALGIVLAGALPPLVAILTQIVLPLAVTVTLRRSARAEKAAAPVVAALERAA